MKKRYFILIIVFLFLTSVNGYSQKENHSSNSGLTNTLETDFLHPPIVYRPFVWWHWLGSNFSKEGITKDLEAMKASGIGGATIFNISSSVVESHLPTLNNPWPDQTYRSPKYWEAIKHAASEAKRLGLDLGLHNTVGYSTTGGPWIDEAQSMQQLVWSETIIEGNANISQKLPNPIIVADEGWGKTGRTVSWFKDIAVLAIPANKSSIKLTEVLDISSKMDANGNLQWSSPIGKWVVYRLAHASTGRPPHPIPDDLLGKVLEADKMSLSMTKLHWTNVIEPLKKHLGPLLGTGLKHFLIDSYEAGNQNWSESFRTDFIRLKGYDPLPWLMTFNATVRNGKKANNPQDPLLPTQREIENKELSARFEWDYKDVISQLFFTNGWKPAANMIHAVGMQVQHEAYGGPFSIVEGSALADIPMREFWSGRKTPANPVVTGSARAAGRNIIAAEALTGSPIYSKWSEVPSFLKPTLDGGYATGVNRMVLHHWVHQPFDDKYQPALGMGWWGTHFSRYQTWYEPGKEFFQYMSRVQTMLQMGETTIYALSLGGDSPLTDIISKDVFLNKLKVVNGKIVLPSGRSYFVLTIPHNGKLLPEIVSKIEDLLQQGATIISAKPVASPSLSNYPNSDATITKLANSLWGKENVPVKQIGKGILYTDSSSKGLNNILEKLGCLPTYKLLNQDLDIQIQQRTNGKASWYFIANVGEADKKFTASFSVIKMIPELWDAETGTIIQTPIWRIQNNATEVDLILPKHKSLFVVFRKNIPIGLDHLTGIEASSEYQINTLKNGVAVLESVIPVTGTMHFKSGKTKSFDLKMADTIPLKFTEEVTFHPPLGKSFISNIKTLSSFSNNTADSIKYFSGTATYKISFELSPTSLKNGKDFQLVLGKVYDLATVKVNGKLNRVFWNPPFTCDLTDLLKVGTNIIEIDVVNSWHNLLVGDEQYPADFEWGVDRGANGRMMKAYPDWFLKNQSRPEKNRKAFVVWYYHKKDTPLLPAGLVGPVYLIAKQTVAATIK
jgi:hypothetical protein